MQRATIEELIAAPIGRWHYTRPLLLWIASPSLCGISYVGHVTSDDLPRLRTLAQLPFHPALQRPYAALIDGRGLATVDNEAFGFLTEHLDLIAQVGRNLVGRLAVVRPAGLTGAAALGLFHQHLVGHVDVHFVDTLAAAFDALDAGAYRDAIQGAIEEAITGSPMIARLRALLREDPTQTLAAVARRLGVGTRSLQRACLDAGSSYRDEVANARLDLASHLLRTSEDKIEAVARRAGYASAASFARRFKEVTGESPAEYRLRQRA